MPSNADSEDKCADHVLVGYIDGRQFLIYVVPGECGYPLLVSRRTGKEMTLESWPNLSPNNKRFVVVTHFEECIVHDTIAIFSLASDPPRLEWRFTPDDPHEDYHFDGWDGDSRVRLRVTVTSVEGKQKEMATDLKLTAQGWADQAAEWKIQPRRPGPG